MITSKDINKNAIMYVRESKTGRLVWRNFGYVIRNILDNGNVRLTAEGQPDIYFDAKDVIAIDK